MNSYRPKTPLKDHQYYLRSIRHLLKDVDNEIDLTRIINQWEKIHRLYRVEDRIMPEPIWKIKGFNSDGRKAWKKLVRQIASFGTSNQVSMYIHVPFCQQHCGFCDCYSYPLYRHKSRYEQLFSESLRKEIDRWCRITPLTEVELSTVHFGGGTPNSLEPDIFKTIIEEIRNRFNCNPRTEWALESTVSLLNDSHREFLRKSGFSRLHIGIQTLQPDLRRKIGRKQDPESALGILRSCLMEGFVTTVDIIYGIPGQTPAKLVQTLKALIQEGVMGISLYGLNLSAKNRWFFEKMNHFKRDFLYNYLLFLTADQVLVKAGYHKNHFVHYALKEDKNLYATHAVRGEDLLALGPSADGIFNGYRYGHPGLKQYLKVKKSDHAFLCGGLKENPMEREVSRIAAQLMGAAISYTIPRNACLDHLFKRWLENNLIKVDEDHPDNYVLTGNGSYFVNNMIEEAREFIGTLHVIPSDA